MNITRDEWREMTAEEAEEKLREIIDDHNGNLYEAIVIDTYTGDVINPMADDDMKEACAISEETYGDFDSSEDGIAKCNIAFEKIIKDIARFLSEGDEYETIEYMNDNENIILGRIYGNNGVCSIATSIIFNLYMTDDSDIGFACEKPMLI